MSEIDKLEVEAERDPFKDVDFAELETSLHRPRTFLSILFSWIVAVMTLLALVPLFSVVLDADLARRETTEPGVFSPNCLQPHWNREAASATPSSAHYSWSASRY